MGSRVRDALLRHVQDKKPYIEVKDAIVARSGIYWYTKEEILARGHKPKVDKDWYAEFRPAPVIVASKNMFELVPVPNKEHTNEYITSENFHSLASGIVGGPIDVVPLEGTNDIALKGKIAFFTKDAYDYYMAGNKETSADYESVSELVDNPEKVGYDLIMTEIRSVNNVAITAHGRGGPKVRVQDSLPAPSSGLDIIDKTTGRTTMGVISAIFGFDKPKESFSAHVKDALSAVKARSTDADIQTALDGVMALVNPFTESHEKQSLIGAVRDSFRHPDEVQKEWSKTAPLLDGLYARCQDNEAAEVAAVQDAIAKKDPPKKEGDTDDDDTDDKDGKKKAAESKDSLDAVIASVQDSNKKYVDEKFGAFEKKIPDLIAEGVKAALGTGAAGEGARHQDSAAVLGDESVDFLFGNEGTGQR